MRIAITGVTGLIGRAAVQRFVERGDDVIAIGRCMETLLKLFKDVAICRESDYSLADLKDALKDIDIVLHLAAMRFVSFSEGFQPFVDANIKTTENVILASCDNGVSRFCQASSISVYSSSNRVPYRESQPPMPTGLYGISKLMCEHIAIVYGRMFPIRVTSLRLASILGDDRIDNFMLMNFIRQAKHKQTLHIWGEGVYAKDIIYVKDVVAAIEKAVDPGAPGGIFNIGSGKAFSVREIAETINEVFDNVDNLVFDTSKKEDKGCYFMDSTKAESELDWKSQWAIKMGLEDIKNEMYD